MRMACNKKDVLSIAVGALLDTLSSTRLARHAWLDTLANVASQIAVLDKQVRTLAQKRKTCWHLMSAPGVAPITALGFTAAIEDPHRFGSNRDIGAYLA